MNYDFLKHGEGFRAAPYLDSAGVPTIGYGTTMYIDGKKVTMSDPPISREYAESTMQATAKRFWNAIVHAIKKDLNENQKTAIISLVYNIGVGGFLGSSLLKLINAGADQDSIRAAFLMWRKITIKDKASGRLMKVDSQGLINRRNKEADLFFS